VLYKRNKDVIREDASFFTRFLGIYYTPTELFVESAKLISKMQETDKHKQKIGALLIVLSNKVVDETVLEKYVEEVRRMGNVILDFFEKIGVEEGLERGLALGEERGLKLGEERRQRNEADIVLKMLAKGYNTQDILEITGINQERLNQIATSN
jgi:predicted transposase YdaD